MESYSWPENLPTYRKRAIEELIRGREFTNQLQSMLTKTVKGEEGSMFPEDLVMKILGSFTETLSILKSTDSDEVSQFPAGLGCRKYEDSGESSKTKVKDRRGCYKRRKTSQTTTKLTPTLIDDGFAWRKYGQKSIHNTNHPRNYYRCTHKFDQECQATKQVQRTEDDPPMYRTTYHGDHTCRNLLKSPQIMLDPTAKDSSYLLSFVTNDPTHKPDGPFFPTIIKQESKEGVQNLVNQTQSPPSNYLMSPDLTTFDSYGPMLSSGSDHGDVISSGVYSCTTSTRRSFEMDTMMLGSGDFDDLQFDFV